jgi:hypothetical protein
MAFRHCCYSPMGVCSSLQCFVLISGVLDLRNPLGSIFSINEEGYCVKAFEVAKILSNGSLPRQTADCGCVLEGCLLAAILQIWFGA